MDYLSDPSVAFIRPDWDAPSCVKAACSTRLAHGVSLAPFDRCNLGDHVGDDPAHVARNRLQLREALGLPSEPYWLKQVHGIEVCDLDQLRSNVAGSKGPLIADASRSARVGDVLAVLTADCLPLLLCSEDGSEVAAAHAGWRGLAAGVIESVVSRMKSSPDRLLAWLGPAIGPQAFEVGEDVHAQFLGQDANAEAAFRRLADRRESKWLCDLYHLARLRLNRLGVDRISGGDRCTFSEARHFFSHRRDRVTGRQVSLIWID